MISTEEFWVCFGMESYSSAGFLIGRSFCKCCGGGEISFVFWGTLFKLGQRSRLGGHRSEQSWNVWPLRSGNFTFLKFLNSNFSLASGCSCFQSKEFLGYQGAKVDLYTQCHPRNSKSFSPPFPSSSCRFLVVEDFLTCRNRKKLFLSFPGVMQGSEITIFEISGSYCLLSVSCNHFTQDLKWRQKCLGERQYQKHKFRFIKLHEGFTRAEKQFKNHLFKISIPPKKGKKNFLWTSGTELP